MSNIYRTTISITQDLKKRMNAVLENVNWSAVAAAAFEAKLLEIARRDKETQLGRMWQRWVDQTCQQTPPGE